MDVALRHLRTPTPLPMDTVVRRRARQQRLGRWALRCAVAFAVLAGADVVALSIGWRDAGDLFARHEWVGGLLALGAMGCAAAWCLAEAHVGTPGRPEALAQLCRLRSLSPEVDRFVREVSAQGRTLTNAEAYGLLSHYAALLDATRGDAGRRVV